METTSLGRFVRERRLALGLTQEELSARSGVSQPVISDIERGRTARSDADIRRRLARELGVRHVDLLVAAGELTAEECGGAVPAVPPAHRRVLAALEKVDATPAVVRLVVQFVELTGAAQRGAVGTVPAPGAGAPTATATGSGRSAPP